MSVVYYTQGDLEPSIDLYLKKADGQPIDLTGASSVTLRVRPTGSAASASPTFTGTMTVFAATSGGCRYALATGDLALVNAYDMQATINWPGARPQAVPNVGYDSLVVQDNLIAG